MPRFQSEAGPIQMLTSQSGHHPSLQQGDPLRTWVPQRAQVPFGGQLAHKLGRFPDSGEDHEPVLETHFLSGEDIVSQKGR